MQNGEITSEMAESPHVTFVVLIGTNNLGSGHLPTPTAEVLRSPELQPKPNGAQMCVLCAERCVTRGWSMWCVLWLFNHRASALWRSGS